MDFSSYMHSYCHLGTCFLCVFFYSYYMKLNISVMLSVTQGENNNNKEKQQMLNRLTIRNLEEQQTLKWLTIRNIDSCNMILVHVHTQCSSAEGMQTWQKFRGAVTWYVAICCSFYLAFANNVVLVLPSKYCCNLCIWLRHKTGMHKHSSMSVLSIVELPNFERDQKAVLSGWSPAPNIRMERWEL